jgi:CRISPR-associated protein Cas1
MKEAASRALEASSFPTLLGVEGAAARTYFGEFASMIRPEARLDGGFDFSTRNRRPPTDPVNCLLSFGYGQLVKDLTTTTFMVGFDPYQGFYHQPRYGRPALALDLAEEFRPLLVESTVITLINNGEVDSNDFITRAGGYSLTASGRKSFLRAYERRMDTEVTHPRFGYRISYRRVLEVQARLLGATLLDEISEYPAFMTR